MLDHHKPKEKNKRKKGGTNFSALASSQPYRLLNPVGDCGSVVTLGCLFHDGLLLSSHLFLKTYLALVIKRIEKENCFLPDSRASVSQLDSKLEEKKKRIKLAVRLSILSQEKAAKIYIFKTNLSRDPEYFFRVIAYHLFLAFVSATQDASAVLAQISEKVKSNSTNVS